MKESTDSNWQRLELTPSHGVMQMATIVVHFKLEYLPKHAEFVGVGLE
jgi:hypothetical protein